MLIPLLFILISCELPTGLIGQKKAKRILDREFTETKLKNPLPSGYARAQFRLNTSGSIDRYMESGLIALFFINHHKYMRQIDSCNQALLGNSLIQNPATEVAAAQCDNRIYKMVLKKNKLIFQKNGEILQT